MFPVAMVEIIFRHCGLGTVEDRGFVHVIPEEGVGGSAGEGRVCEEGLPPRNGGRVEAIDPVGGAGPAPAFVDAVVFVFDGEGLGFHVFDDRVAALIFDVRVDDYD